MTKLFVYTEIVKGIFAFTRGYFFFFMLLKRDSCIGPEKSPQNDNSRVRKNSSDFLFEANYAEIEESKITEVVPKSVGCFQFTLFSIPSFRTHSEVEISLSHWCDVYSYFPQSTQSKIYIVLTYAVI